MLTRFINFKASAHLRYLSRSMLQHKLPESYQYGPGGKPNQIPSDLEQATGAERIELISKLQGIDPYDMSVTTLEKKGTVKAPIIVKSLGMNDRVVGCYGVKEEHHDIQWIMLEGKEIRQCPECGNAFQLDDEVGQDDHH